MRLDWRSPGIAESLHGLHPTPGRRGGPGWSFKLPQALGAMAGSVNWDPHLPLWEESSLEHTSSPLALFLLCTLSPAPCVCVSPSLSPVCLSPPSFCLIPGLPRSPTRSLSPHIPLPPLTLRFLSLKQSHSPWTKPQLPEVLGRWV